MTNAASAPSFSPASETTAVSLLQLLSNVEASAVAPAPLKNNEAGEPYIISLDEICTPSSELTAYMAETLQTITQAVFSEANQDFYARYKGLGPEDIFEIVLTRDDLRPLAYRAIFYTERHIEEAGAAPFAPRFVQSLLLLQKHWDANFLQPFKDVAGNLSLQSINKALGRAR